MADLNLDAIRERAAGATEGPWFAWDRGVGWYIGVGDPANPASWDMWNRPARCLPEGERTDIGSEADAQFIAHARTDVPALIEEVERLRKRVDEAHDALSRIDDGDDGVFNTLESTVDHVVRSYRNIAVSESLAADEIDRLRAGNANLIKNAEILADELIHANVERDRLRDELARQIEETRKLDDLRMSEIEQVARERDVLRGQVDEYRQRAEDEAFNALTREDQS